MLDRGVNVASVSKNLVDAVRFMLRRIAEFDDVDVRVHVEGRRA